MMPYIAFNALMYTTVSPFMLIVTCLRYIYGAVFIRRSAKFPLRRRTTLSSSFLILVCMKALRMSITATSLTSLESIVDVSSTDSSAAVGYTESYLSMVPRCFLPPATIRPLMVLTRFCFRNKCDSNTFHILLLIGSGD